MPADPSRWQCLPGNFDSLKTQWLFPSTNAWGIPEVQPAPLSAVPDWLAPYRTRIRSDAPIGRGAVHFFLHDYRFESVWTNPHRGLKAIQTWEVVLSPDFSLYRDWPWTLQLWNVYRNRWCHAFWGHHGSTVIPTVSWSTPEFYPFAFAGVPRRSVLAVGTVGTRWEVETERRLFEAGWHAMVETLDPTVVLVYGNLPEELSDSVDTRIYPTYWQGVVRLRRQQHGR
jgi:hypothetical protein